MPEEKSALAIDVESKREDDTAEESVVFVVDISVSMGVTTEVAGKHVLEGDRSATLTSLRSAGDAARKPDRLQFVRGRVWTTFGSSHVALHAPSATEPKASRTDARTAATEPRPPWRSSIGPTQPQNYR